MLSNRLLSATALATSLIVVPGVAFAQAAQPVEAGQVDTTTEQSADQAEDANTVVVTGSRIRRPNLESTIPITSVGSEQIVDTGQISVGDQLNQLPQLRSTFTQANSTRFIGTAGSNFLDLRGLGTERTLVLLNGRRFVSTSPKSFRWDVNYVPADLIDRVDVVTGGNSAIYGSDAIAGVVNFVLKRKYEGLQLRGQAGISSEGDSGSQFVSGIIGKNFAEGKGNITLATEYAHQEALYVLDREQGRDRRQFQLVQNLGAQLNPANGPIRTSPEPAAGDGIPDTAFIGGLRRVTTSTGGTFTSTCPTAAATGESPAAFAARRAIACSGILNPGSTNTLSQFGNAFAFLPDGTLVPNGCTTDFRGFGSGNCIGGLGSTLRESGQLQPMLERFNATLLASYEVSPAFEPFFEGQYVRINAIQESSQPTFGPQVFSINNPFLTTQARNLIISASAPGATTFSYDRQNIDFGGRGEKHRRELYRAVVGARGTFNDDWSYEISANYGRFTSFYGTEGNYDRVKFANALNAVLAPAGFTGTTVSNAAGQRVACAINTDAVTTNDDAACVPVNTFGLGQVTQQARNYFIYRSTRDEKNTEFVINGFVSGDTSGFFNLPGGPVGFALGGEYREEKQYQAYDAFTQTGGTFLNIIPTFNPPKYKVKEAFGEIRFPLLANLPLAEELTVEGAGRVSDYNLGKTGTVWAYNAGVIWAPVRDIRFRGSYQRSVRAPTLGDLYTPPTQTFNNSFLDPCGQQNINNGPNRKANCAAAGVPTTQTFTVGGTTTTEPFSNRPNSGVAAANAGQLNLTEERGTSWTLGAVVQPRFIPGFSVSVDYYNIKIDDVIFTLAPQTVIDQCYDSPSGIDNPYCAQVFRLPNGTLAGQANVQHNGGVVTLNNPGFSSIGAPFNYAKLQTKGIDLNLNYKRDFSSNVSFSTNLVVSYLISRDSFTDATQPTFRTRIKSTFGDPEWRGQLNSSLKVGDVTFSHRLQYVGKQIQNIAVNDPYNTYFTVDGRAPTNPDTTPFIYYPETVYNDFRLEFDVQKRHSFYVGVDNAFNVAPPYDLIGTEAGSLFDPTGRFFYAGFRAKF